ncbi:MAG: hypothetical protein U0S36_07010 [Candidatus Nanopelagicales bacterium]
MRTPQRVMTSCSCASESAPDAVRVTCRRPPGARSSVAPASRSRCTSAIDVSSSSRSAGTPRATLPSVELRAKRHSHAATGVPAARDTANAPSRRARLVSPERTMPGAANGTTWLGTRWPALPSEVPNRSPPESSSSTLRPRRAADDATERPTMPPPTTTTSTSSGSPSVRRELTTGP